MVFCQDDAGIPHWYIVKHKSSAPELFPQVVDYIYNHGVEERFGKRVFKYLYLGDFKYWCMGAPVNETTIINRTKIKQVKKSDIEDQTEQILEDKTSD